MIKNIREPIGRKFKLISLDTNKINQLKIEKKCISDNYENSKELLHNVNQVKRRIYNNHNYLWIFITTTIIFISLLLIYGIYLDRKIRIRIDGKVWQLPAIVYGRIINFEPNMLISKNEVIKLLKATQYRQVSKINCPGEFIVKDETIEIIRRPFDFPDIKEDKMHVLLTFNGNHLETIKNKENNLEFGFFRLDPPLIAMFSSPNGEYRLFLDRKSFPDLLINILLATEDRNFYNHDGVNLYSIGRAILANLAAGRKVQGASTLTQQLVRNLFLTSKRSYWRKVNEAYMAIMMDARYSKDRILELYMNEVYFGQNGDNEIRGFPLASLYYLGRPIKELSLDQQALLVGMIKGASTYNPWRNPKLTLDRRNLILRLLKKQQIINQNLYNILKVRKLGVLPRGGITSPHPAFMQIVRQELHKKLGDRVKNLSGAKIFTTFDSISQNAAEKAAIECIPSLRKEHNLKDLEVAIVVVDRYTGEVRAIVGSSDPQYAGYNRAIQARRSIGSLAKPATYLTALSQPNKYRLNTWIADTPFSLYQSNGQTWSPKNDDRKFRNQVMLVDALIHSINIPTVNLGMSLGLSAITETWQKLGVPKEQLQIFPSMILGALNLTPIEVAQVFQSIASVGNRAYLSVLSSVITEDSKLLYQSYPQAERTISAQAAYMTLWAMQQVVQDGTGRQLGKKYPNFNLAGKTGTTNNNIDTWFAGIDGREVVVIWLGRDNNQPTKLYGANGAMSIYQNYLINKPPVSLDIIPPENIVSMDINDLGNFVCFGGTRKLPVWTINPDVLCQQDQIEQLVNNYLIQSLFY